MRKKPGILSDRRTGTPSAVSRSSPPSSAVSTQAPFGVRVKVCSKWAAREPSAVTTVQSSARTSVSLVPSVTIGSTASARPGTSFGPRPGRPTLGTLGGMCIWLPMPWPT